LPLKKSQILQQKKKELFRLGGKKQLSKTKLEIMLKWLMSSTKRRIIGQNSSLILGRTVFGLTLPTLQPNCKLLMSHSLKNGGFH